MSLLAIDKLSIRYGETTAVADIGFSIEKGESVGLVGESGSGKSQTALAVLGLLPTTATVAGSIRFDGQELLGADNKTLDQLRATRIAIVFQDPMQALNPFVTIGAQLQRILLQHDIGEAEASREHVVEMLVRVGLPDASRQYGAFPHELSGGMRQRAMIASALLAGPDLLIADEPTTALDVTVQAQILDLLEDIREDTSLLLITHDLGVVAGRCERMLVVENGRLVEQGMTREIFAHPQHEHTRAMIKAAPRLTDSGVAAARPGKDVLAISAAQVRYRSKSGQVILAVRDVNLAVSEGETLAVVGESGSGKSSLVRAALGLVPMHAGRVVYCGDELAPNLGDRNRATRRGMQLVFQDPTGSLNPQMRVAGIVGEPLLVHEAALSAGERRQRVATMLEKTGLSVEFLDRYPHELSGGQAQRVAIARALILEPKVLVCDEAVAALDGTVREQILRLLRQVQEESGLAIIFITHDLAVVRAVSHRVLVMYLGRLVEMASNEALFGQPRHPYTRALLDAVPVPDPENAGGRTTVTGEVPSAMLPPKGCAFHPRCPHAEAVCRAERPEATDLNETLVSCHRATELA
ncbi:MAG: dipeptide ABC transporter ATP-binding protein [Woeseiaceae bacterium]|jgi:oligopeptide/dipeptide ABC transporter ATP-binding protein|nr:dipeptide ABC transporter ATP-binding protein [Woeseiaceae bacterium]